ncbi:transposase family protein [Sediminicurvatus halobius]|uniref:transposase family protein n=1 Tax=Sediminicurvatus halobius TaxID=2182432 RepID=UPI0011B258C8|nr:transposase family protein [Spiribacter halobius]UEX76566.1 hypothetical protein LMH63_11410 [Spiribacter halobius]
MPLDALHNEFLAACREAGIKHDEYPLAPRSQARESLRRYLHTLRDQPHAKSPPPPGSSLTGKHEGRAPAILRAHRRPLAVCQLDAHLIDTHCSALISGPWMVPVRVLLPRLWLLVVVDTASRAALGHHLSLHSEYTADDVLSAIRNAILPWTPRRLTAPGVVYQHDAGFPSGLILGYRGALFDVLQLDNALSHRSHAVVTAIVKQLHALAHFGPPGVPEVRNDVERLFRTFASQIHRLPTTTGSGPSDPRRTDDQNAALTHGVDLAHIEDLIDVILANYNARANSVNGQSPLEYMRNSERQLGPMIRRLSSQGIETFRLTRQWVNATIRARDKNSNRPYIRYAYADYSSPYLKAIPSLIGEKVRLAVDTDDVRFVDVYFGRTGAYIGRLQAEGGWGLTPHSLRTRKAIAGACRQAKLRVGAHDDPVQRYLEHLGRKTLDTGKNANHVIEIAREMSGPRFSSRQVSTQSEYGDAGQTEYADATSMPAPHNSNHRGTADARSPVRPLRPWTSIIKK